MHVCRVKGTARGSVVKQSIQSSAASVSASVVAPVSPAAAAPPAPPLPSPSSSSVFALTTPIISKYFCTMTGQFTTSAIGFNSSVPVSSAPKPLVTADVARDALEARDARLLSHFFADVRLDRCWSR